ncbi:MAG: DinB family protein [Actinomycetota bacterium]
MDRRQLLQRYREGYDVLVESLRDITPAELGAREGHDEWSPQQVVNHCADSELNSAIRLRKLIAEENPVIYGYDEKDYAERLHYDRPYGSSLAAVKGAR